MTGNYTTTNYNENGVQTIGGTENVTGTENVSGALNVTGTEKVGADTAIVGGRVYTNVAASSAVTASSTETLFDAQHTIPANALLAGQMIKIKYQGIVTASHTTDTLIVKLYIGGLAGTALLTSSTTDAVNSDIFEGECTVIIRTIGASGTFVAVGAFTKVEAASGTATRVSAITASTAIDTTAAQVVGASATWSTTDAGNSCRLDILAVEIV